jgi:hypothetical protein
MAAGRRARWSGPRAVEVQGERQRCDDEPEGTWEGGTTPLLAPAQKISVSVGSLDASRGVRPSSAGTGSSIHARRA